MSAIVHTTFTTPSGERFVLITPEVFAEIQDALDVAAAEKTRAAVRRGEQEVLTSAEMKAALAAATPLAFWRQKRGLTQKDLAASVGISQSYLAGLEAGNRKGDPARFKQLASALHVRMEDLVDAP